MCVCYSGGGGGGVTTYFTLRTVLNRKRWWTFTRHILWPSTCSLRYIWGFYQEPSTNVWPCKRAVSLIGFYLHEYNQLLDWLAFVAYSKLYHTRRETKTDTHSHKDTQTQTNTLVTHTHTHTHTNAHTHARAHTHTHTHTSAHKHMHTTTRAARKCVNVGCCILDTRKSIQVTVADGSFAVMGHYFALYNYCVVASERYHSF